MNRKPTSLPGETWEFFSACIYYLGKTVLTTLFQRGERQIERWSADPKTSNAVRNPVDRYEELLHRLMEEGCQKIARAVVARQAHIVGCTLTSKSLPIPDKDTLEHELIDDIPVKAVYDQVLLDPAANREMCKNALDDIVRELTENYVKKCRLNGWTP